jgi:hypothetical protein
MKTIGRTNDGEYLVEMNHDEHKALVNLSRAINGDTPHELKFAPMNELLIVDLSGPLGSVRAYTETLFMINNLSSYLKNVEGALRRKLTEEDKDTPEDSAVVK